MVSGTSAPEVFGTVSAPSAIVVSGATIPFTLQIDAQQSRFAQASGHSVVFSLAAGTTGNLSTGTFAPAIDNGNGSYNGIFTGVTSGLPAQVAVTVDGQNLSGTPPQIQVVPGPFSLAQSQVLPPYPVTLLPQEVQEIIVLARDDAGNLLPSGGLSVNLSASPSGICQLGAVNDNLNGTYSASLTALSGGTTTVVPTINGQPLTSASVQVTVTSVAGVANQSPSIDVTSSALPGNADGQTPISVTAVVTASNGSPIGGAQVTVTSSRGASDVVNPPINVTDSSGQAQFLVTSTLVGSLVLSVTATSGAGMVSQSLAAAFTAQSPSPSLSAVAANPLHPLADGSHASSVTIRLVDPYGQAVSGKQIRLTSSRGSADTISPATLNTDGNGSAVFTVTSRTAGLVTLSALDVTDELHLLSTGAISFVAGPVSSTGSKLTAGPTTITADNTQASTISIILLDAHGNPVPGKSVSPGSSRTALDHFDETSGFTDSTGLVTFHVRSAMAGMSTISAIDTSDSLTLPATATLSWGAGPAAANLSTVGAGLTSLVANGVATSTLTVTLVDKTGNPAAGRTVTLSSSRGAADLITPSSRISNASGVASFTVASTTAGASVLQATDSTDGVVILQQPTITFVAGPVSASRSTLTVSPSAVTADGSTAATATLTFLDSFGNPVPNKITSLASTRGSLDVIQSSAQATNSAGQMAYHVTSKTTGVSQLSAVDTSDALNVTATVTLTFNAGIPNIAKSSITVTPTTLVADGVTSCSVVVTLKDASGNLVPAETLALSSSRGSSDIITSSNPVSGTNGQVTFNVVSTLAGTATFTATDVARALTFNPSSVVTFQPGAVAPAMSTLTITPANVPSDGVTSGQFQLRLADAFGNGVPGKSVVISSSRGASDTLSPTSTATDSTGLAVFTVTSTVAGNATFTATDTTDSLTVKTVTATFLPGIGNAAHSTVVASPTSVTANGTTTSTVTVVMKDINSNVVPGVTVGLTSSRGASDHITPATAVTSATGTVTYSVTSTLAGAPVFTAADSTDSVTVTQTTTVTFTAGPVSNSVSTVVLSPVSVPANGSTTATITATLLDANSNPVSGKTVTLTASRGASDTISPASAVSSALGVATFTVKSSTHGTSTLTATDTTDTVTLAPTPTLTFSLSASQVSVFQDHGCTVMSTGAVECWGWNFYGQVGDGSTTDRNVPVSVSGISTATAVAVGAWHSCALLANHTVQCWGLNTSGQIGDGTNTQRLTPVTVSGISTATAIAAGQAHTCALLSTGAIKCWGYDAYSQLGDAGTTNQNAPVAVASITTATAITAESLATCARLSTGVVDCWGYNGYGGIGDGTTTNRTAPTAVSGISTATAIGAGYYHACAVLTGGTAKCWGNNANGQIGDGTTTQRTSPVAVSGVTTASKIAGVGMTGSCLILASGQLQCWGLNLYGSVGDGTLTQRLTPVNVTGLSSASTVAGGFSTTCATLSDGSARCWGNNPFGNLGDGITGAKSIPVAAVGVSSPTSIAVGFGHTCALFSSGAVQCWGSNAYGQLGDGTTTDRTSPVTATGILNAVAIAAGQYHTCAVLANGSMSCWGLNGNGQIGDGTNTQRLVPTAVSGITTATQVATGSLTSCALLSNGTAKCWGSNASGTVGDGTNTDRSSPTAVSGLASATQIAMTGAHVCAVISGGTVMCWGNNIYGQIGDGTQTNRTTPVAVTGLSAVSAVAAGGLHSCALKTNGTVACWGYNSDGQIGDGTLTNRLSPVSVTGLSSVSSIAVGPLHSCALLSTQAINCWGDNGSFELGNGASSPFVSSIGAVSGISSAASLYLGNGYQSFAILGNGTLDGWGGNGWGQLEQGSAGDSHVPAVVQLQ